MKSVSEDDLDDAVHAVDTVLRRCGITLDCDELSLLNQRIENFLFDDVGVELD